MEKLADSRCGPQVPILAYPYPRTVEVRLGAARHVYWTVHFRLDRASVHRQAVTVKALRKLSSFRLETVADSTSLRATSRLTRQISVPEHRGRQGRGLGDPANRD